MSHLDEMPETPLRIPPFVWFAVACVVLLVLYHIFGWPL